MTGKCEMFSMKFEGKCKYLVSLNLWVYGNCTLTQHIKKSWLISGEHLNLLSVNMQENTGFVIILYLSVKQWLLI